MKRLVKTLAFAGVAASLLASCAKELSIPVEPTEDSLIDVTIIAGNPESKDDTKTMIEDGKAYWTANDAIGVVSYTVTVDEETEKETTKYSNNKFDIEESVTDKAVTAAFSGKALSCEKAYAYHPYSTIGVNNYGVAKVAIPSTQKPTVSSFDSDADIMISKQFAISTSTVENLEFARLGAILKLVLKGADEATATILANEHPSVITFTAASDLVGKVYLDGVNQELGELYDSKSTTVSAEYTSATQFALNGSNPAYLIVYPQKLAAASEVTVYAETENYKIERTISLPREFDLQIGNINTLNVKISATELTKVEKGLALPFEDNFSWTNAGSTDGSTAIALSAFPKTTDGDDMYSSVSDPAYVAKEGYGIKFGSSKVNGGHITTADLDLSEDYTIIVRAADYGSDGSKLVVSVGETALETKELSSDIQEFVFTQDAATAKTKIKFEITGKRGYIAYVKVEKGHDYVPSATIKVDKTLALTSDEVTATITPVYTNAASVSADIYSDAEHTSEPDWIVVSVKEDNSIEYYALENEDTDPRTAYLVITAKNSKDEAVTAEVVITQSGATASGKVRYSYTISTSDFSATGYGKDIKDVTATSEDGKKTMKVSHKDNNAGLQSGKIQFKKSAGYLYNTTDLGTVISVVLNDASVANSYALYTGISENPSTTVDGGYFCIKETAGNTLTCSSITVVFEIEDSDTSGPGEDDGEEVTYSYTIATSDFSASGYGKDIKDVTATSADGKKTLTVSHADSNAGLQNSKIQFKKSAGYLYNTTDLGTVLSVVLNDASAENSYTVYTGTSENPSTTVDGGYFCIKETGGNTLTCSSITVTFKK